MKKKPTQRIVYNAKYYLTQRLLKNRDFRKAIDDLKKEFAKYGCPIPKGGVQNLEGLFAWRRRLAVAHNKVHRGKKYNNALRAITGGAEKISREQFLRVCELEETALPPIAYGYRIDRIMEEFDLDPKSSEDRDWMDHLIFFNRTDYPTTLAEMKFIPGGEGKDPELWVRYLAHTKPSDIPSEALKEFQKLLPEYRNRNRPRKISTLERNAEVKRAYYKAIEGTMRFGTRRPAGDSAARAVVRLLKTKYSELNEKLVQKIVSRG